jgi:hypothetical protein
MKGGMRRTTKSQLLHKRKNQKFGPEGEENEPHAQREEKGGLKEENGRVKTEQEGREEAKLNTETQRAKTNDVPHEQRESGAI